MSLFEDAVAWQKRKDRGETQKAIAKSLDRSQADISRTLKYGRLPTEERQRYAKMIADRQMTEGAVMDLADIGDSELRKRVLALAIRHRSLRDAEAVNQTGKRGMRSDAGKITVDEIRSALKKEVHESGVLP